MRKGYALMIVMLFFSLVGTLAGCSDDDNTEVSGTAKMLVGAWQSESTIETFREDGTGFCESLDRDYEFSFTWKLEGSKLSIIDDGEAEIYNIESIDENTLVLSFTWDWGEISTITYKRIG